MKGNLAIGAALVAVVIALTALLWSQQQHQQLVDAIYQLQSNAPTAGGTTNYDELSLKAQYGTTTLGVYGSGTAKGGCVEMNATSSLTKINLRFLAIATTSANGFVTWSYGTCK